MTELIDAGQARPPRPRLSELGAAPRRGTRDRALSAVLQEMRRDERW